MLLCLLIIFDFISIFKAFKGIYFLSLFTCFDIFLPPGAGKNTSPLDGEGQVGVLNCYKSNIHYWGTGWHGQTLFVRVELARRCL